MAYREVCKVHKRPANLLCHPRYGIDDNLSHDDEHDVDDPSACGGERPTHISLRFHDNPRLVCAPLRLTQSALTFGYTSWSSIWSFVLSTFSTFTKLPLRARRGAALSALMPDPDVEMLRAGRLIFGGEIRLICTLEGPKKQNE